MTSKGRKRMVIVVVFCYYDKIPEMINTERFILVQNFRRFRAHGRAKLFIS
jgi:hypothetical protein